MAREWQLAVDLGTTRTRAAYTTPGSGSPVVVTMPATQLAWFPTAVARSSDGRWLVGDAAESRRLSRPDWYWDDVKRHVGSDESYLLGGHPFAPVEAITQPLLHAARLARRHAGRVLDRLVLSAPVCFTAEQLAALREAGENAGFAPDTITTVDEALASSRSALGPRPEDGLWLVVDIGGGTFDAALLAADHGLSTVLDQTGDDTAGGNALDTAVVAWLRERYQIDDGADDGKGDGGKTGTGTGTETGDGAGADRADTGTGGDDHAARRRGLYLRAAARTLREQLSEARTADVFLPDLALELTLTAVRLRQLAGPVLAPAIERCAAMLGRHDLSWEKLSAVVLTGGAAHSPAVRAEFEALAPLRVAAAPELTVVLGLTVPAGASNRVLSVH